MTIVESTRPVTGGVDTHADVHVAAAVDTNGGVLGVESFATTPAGYPTTTANGDPWSNDPSSGSSLTATGASATAASNATVT